MKASSGGSAGAARRKNQEMAGHMKTLGIEREQGRCCVCNRIISVDRPQVEVGHKVFDHISKHSRGA